MQRERLRKKIDNYFSKNKTPHGNSVNDNKSIRYDSNEKSFRENSYSKGNYRGQEATQHKYSREDRNFTREKSVLSTRSSHCNTSTDQYKECDDLVLNKGYSRNYQQQPNAIRATSTPKETLNKLFTNKPAYKDLRGISNTKEELKDLKTKQDSIEEQHQKKIYELLSKNDSQEEQLRLYKDQEKKLKEQVYGLKDTNLVNQKKIYSFYNTEHGSRAEKNQTSKRYQSNSNRNFELEHRIGKIEDEICGSKDVNLNSATSRVRNEMISTYEHKIKTLETKNQQLIRELSLVNTTEKFYPKNWEMIKIQQEKEIESLDNSLKFYHEEFERKEKFWHDERQELLFKIEEAIQVSKNSQNNYNSKLEVLLEEKNELERHCMSLKKKNQAVSDENKCMYDFKKEKYEAEHKLLDLKRLVETLKSENLKYKLQDQNIKDTIEILQSENSKIKSENSKKILIFCEKEENLKKQLIKLSKECEDYKKRCKELNQNAGDVNHLYENVKSENDTIKFAYQTTQQAITKYISFKKL